MKPSGRVTGLQIEAVVVEAVENVKQAAGDAEDAVMHAASDVGDAMKRSASDVGDTMKRTASDAKQAAVAVSSSLSDTSSSDDQYAVSSDAACVPDSDFETLEGRAEPGDAGKRASEDGGAQKDKRSD